MMNIREFFQNLYDNAQDDFQFDEVVSYENNVYEMDDEDFETWAQMNDVDLTARDERTGELVTTLWSWDMCGD